jgi:DNA-binding NtrC family response regulator
MNTFLSHQLVLIADDEPSIVKITGRIITRMGLTPLTVTNGAAAIKAVEDHHANICCIVLDIIMPIMNGVDAALTIQQIAPTIPIILMSAWFDDHSGAMKKLRFADLIIKPFTVNLFHASILHAIHGNALEANV